MEVFYTNQPKRFDGILPISNNITYSIRSTIGLIIKSIYYLGRFIGKSAKNKQNK